MNSAGMPRFLLVKYLSPKQLGQAIGVSESSLKRWIDEGMVDVIRTTGGHRRIELAEAIRFVRQRGYIVQDPAVLGLNVTDDQRGRADTVQLGEYFYELLVNGRDKEFTAAMTRLYLDGRLIAELIDGPIRTAMARIDELWHDAPAGIGIEHRATDICIRTIGFMHSLIKPPDKAAPFAVGAAPPKDIRIVPSLCVSLVLAEQGWREANLGANTPWHQLLHLAQQQQASLVWVSMTREPKAEDAKRLTELTQKLQPQSCQVIIGGGQLSKDIARLDLGNLHIARSMAELQSFSKGVFATHQAMQAAKPDSAPTPNAPPSADTQS